MRRARVVCPLAALAMLAAMSPAVGAAGRRAKTSHMYGRRYCEYLAVKGQPPKLTADVWNSYGLDTCPERLWRKSDAAALAKSMGALTVVLNGPRYWLVDSAAITIPARLGQVRKFSSGLRMRRIATVDVPVHNGVPGNKPYSQVVVNRRNSFTWSHRYPVYELVSPRGRVYVMQSYAQSVDKHLRLSALPHLGRRLHLPAGWHFRRRALSHDLTLTTTSRAIVVQDDMQNTYQLVKSPR